MMTGSGVMIPAMVVMMVVMCSGMVIGTARAARRRYRR